MASQYPNINGRCQCGRCQNALVVQGPAKGGNFPGRHFLHCMACHWHYTFPMGIAPESASQVALTMSNVGQTAVGGTKIFNKCSRAPCKKNAHGSCQNVCCKKCCLVQGGCNVRDHKASSSSGPPQPPSSQFSSSAPPTISAGPPPPTIVIDPTLTFDILAQQLSDADPLRQLQLQEEIRAEKERDAAEREAELDRQEEEDFQNALAASRAALRSPSSDSSIASTSLLPVGESIANSAGSRRAQAGPHSAKSSQQPPSSSLLVSGIPVTRVTAANKPTITTQMNPNWMRIYEDKTQQPPALTGRGQLDVEMVQRFRVIWWGQSKKAPVFFIVQACPQWPKWRITDCSSTFKRVGDASLEFYDLQHNIWLECPVSCPHLVKTDGYLLLRRSGVICEDFETQLAVATRRPSTSRVYMSTARKDLKRKGKARAIDNVEDTEGEVEIVESFGSSKKKKIKQEPDVEIVFSPTCPLLSPLANPGLSPTGLSVNNPISILDSPRLSPSLPSFLGMSTDPVQSFVSWSAASRSVTPILAIPVSVSGTPLSTTATTPSPAPGIYDIASPLTGPPPRMPGSTCTWPSNMYVVDMVYGFRRMDQLLKANQGNYEDRFYAVFGQQPPSSSTYYDQTKRWELATPAIREAALAAQRTSAGQWARFARLVPLKK
ncbi:hypothetical protein BDZ97DRAFT_1706816 [Flammula alnicola]|nr:hypothetical protein BDZ97DRAFT_1706816 [Flammula alnicola]